MTTPSDVPSVGQMLRGLRKSRDLGPTEMAKKLGEHGRPISKQHLLYIEQDAKSHPKALLDAYRAALALPDWVAGPIYERAGAYFAPSPSAPAVPESRGAPATT